MNKLTSSVNVLGDRVNQLEQMTSEEETYFLNLPVNVSEVISDRQFAQQLKNMGLITQEEALAFVGTGQLPSGLSSVVSAIPDQTLRENIELSLAGAVEYHRHHPFTVLIGTSYGFTSDQLDTLWIEASQL